MANRCPLVFKAGIVAGIMDGLGASLKFYWRTGNGPEGVFKFVGSGAAIPCSRFNSFALPCICRLAPGCFKAW
jgi:hypothetical protein